MWPFRKSTSLDYILQVIRIAKMTKSEIEAAEKTGNTERIKKLLRIIKKFEISEFHRIEEETGSRTLMTQCEQIYRLINETTKDLDNHVDFEQAKQIIDRIISLEEIIQREILDKSHNLDKYKLGALAGVGGNSKVYRIIGHPNLVMIVSGSTGFGGFSQDRLRLANVEIILYKKVPSSVNAPKVLEAGKISDYVGIVMERARGRPLHDRHAGLEVWRKDIRFLARTPKRHYHKLVEDYRILHSIGLELDPSKPDNIFYHREIGFSFIDLHKGRGFSSLSTPILFPFPFYSNLNSITVEDFNNIKLIVQKLREAGDSCDKGDEMIDDYLNRH